MNPKAEQPVTQKSNVPQLWEILLGVSTLAVVLIYIYAFFFRVPYIGFRVSGRYGYVIGIFSDGALEGDLRLGDQLIQLGESKFDGSQAILPILLTKEYKTGETLHIVIQRDGESYTFLWVIPGITWSQLRYRLISTWWLPLLLWGTATVIVFMVHPRDLRRNLLVIFNYLSALFFASTLIAGTTLLGSHLIQIMTIWLLWPVSWHLNWVFPRRFFLVPAVVWSILYLSGFSIAGLSLIGVIPISPIQLFASGLVVIGSLILLILHSLFQKMFRPLVYVILGFVFLAILLFIFLQVTPNPGPAADILNFAVVLSLAAVPLGYLHALTYHQPGDLEIRVNQTITYLSYAVICVIISISVLGFTFQLVERLHFTESVLTTVIAIVGIALGFGFTRLFPPYQRWIETKVLGIPIPQKELIEHASTRVTTSLEWDKLSRLLREEILPSLLIRQAALLRIQPDPNHPDSYHIQRTLLHGVEDTSLPPPGEIHAWLAYAGKSRNLDNNHNSQAPGTWVRLSLALKIEDQPIGLLLLGRRDPDDYYAHSELGTLQTLANQMALAIIQIEQAQLLRELHQQDIERQEAEKSRLARELHDDVLGRLAVLANSIPEDASGERISQVYQQVVDQIRDLIAGLRPTMINFGLYLALSELVDETIDHIDTANGNKPVIKLEMAPSQVRYPPEVELHLYRITQQALSNALAYAHSSRIVIQGQLEPSLATIIVKDDGIGFPSRGRLDLIELLAKKHFGLAGIYERAALIKADLAINSSPGEGVTVKTTWRNTG